MDRKSGALVIPLATLYIQDQEHMTCENYILFDLHRQFLQLRGLPTGSSCS